MFYTLSSHTRNWTIFLMSYHQFILFLQCTRSPTRAYNISYRRPRAWLSARARKCNSNTDARLSSQAQAQRISIIPCIQPIPLSTVYEKGPYEENICLRIYFS